MPRIMAENDRIQKHFCKQMLRTLFLPRNLSQFNTTECGKTGDGGKKAAILRVVVKNAKLVR
jgi:hypothetical protein